MTAADAGRLAVTLAIGSVGGALFAWWQLPLAWMLGAMGFTLVASMAGAPTTVPAPLRNAMITVLGVMLGSAFSPELVDHLDEWLVTGAFLAVYVVVSLAAGLLFLRRVARYDRVTAFFTAAPGGFNEMVTVGSALGGDERVISLSHSLRIVLVVIAIPFGFQYFAGYERGAGGGLGPIVPDLGAVDAVLLAACAVAIPPARWLRLPAPWMLGPMVASATIHVAGLTHSKPPALFVIAAMIVIGASIGARFRGVRMRTLLRTLAVSLVMSLILLALSLASSWFLHAVTGLPFGSILLAYAPGGFAEMSLVSLAMGLDPAFVSSHHLARVIFVIALVPIAFRLVERWSPLPAPPLLSPPRGAADD
jgi:hypothetical protein